MDYKNGRNQFRKIKWVLIILEKFYRLLPLKARKRKLENKRYKRGKLGLALRYVLLKSIAKSIGDNVSIHQGCFLLNPEGLEIGENVSIHPMCYIDASGGIKIGDNVSIAHGVTILSSTHTYIDKEIPIKYQDIVLLRTEIENDCWIGAKATIIGGVNIGTGCVIGATSVVTHNIENNSVVVGVPGKKIKSR